MMLFVIAAPIGFVGSNLLFSHIPIAIVAGILAFSG